MKRYVQLALLVPAVALVVACATPTAQPSQPASAPTVPLQAAKAEPSGSIRILVTGFSVGFAPAVVMQKEQLIEKKYPKVKTEWIQTFTGSTANDMLIANNTDVAIFAIPPLLIGMEKGVDAKIVAACTFGPFRLNTSDPNYKSIADFKAGDKIGTPGPTSIQAMLLAMKAESDLKNSKALEPYLITMPHPDAYASLLSGQIKAHFAIPPEAILETKQPGIHTIMTGADAFGGPVMVNVFVASRKFHDEKPELYKVLYEGITDAINFVNTNRDATAKDLVATGTKVEPSDILEQLNNPEVKVQVTPKGLMRWATWMKQNGYIKTEYKSWKEMTWENLWGHDVD